MRIRLEGAGVRNSITLRKFYREKYKVDVRLYSYGGCFSPSFNLGGTVKIGQYCLIAQGVRYYGANHPIEKAVMSAFFTIVLLGFLCVMWREVLLKLAMMSGTAEMF